MTRPTTPTRVLGLLSAALLPGGLLSSCTEGGVGLYLDPPEPVFVSTEAACTDSVLTLVALIDSELPASNLVITPSEEDGFERDVVYPVNDLTQADDRITRWTVEIEHDCNDTLVLDWTAYTTMATQASLSTRYPLTAPDVEGVTPPYGSTAGGDLVTLTGPWMDEVSEVWFGEEGATLLDADADGLQVETPANDAGLVDVRIVGEGGETVLSEAFTYYEDKSGLYRGIGNFNLSFYSEALLGYDSAYGAVDGPFAQLEMVFHELDTEEAHWWYRYPGHGECDALEWGGFTAVTVGNYIDLNQDELGSFAMVTAEGGTTYYSLMGDVTVDDWAGRTFDLTWSDDLEDMPAMSLPGGIRTAPYPDGMSIDWAVSEEWTRGEDLVVTFVPDEALSGAWVTPIVTNSGNGVLGSSYCGEDLSDGEFRVDWADLVDGVDPAQAARVYLRVDYYSDQPIVMPHDHSLVWAKGVNTVWYRLEIVEP
jgi:hypothetical protein